jgi:aspartate/tyrosine/aromatic aminotransferase
MFEQLQHAPADAIFGLNEQFLRDPNPDKINLTVGVYQDEHGQTPILECVREAERRLFASEATKDYLSMGGLSEFNQAVSKLVLKSSHSAGEARASATLQTLGGTGALRLTGDLLARSLDHKSIWYSEPTWPNHLGIFRAAGLNPIPYRYLDPRGGGLDFSGMLEDLQRIPRGSAFVVHTVCHNPTGFDLSHAQWEELAELASQRNLIAVFDFAYQGLADSMEEDAWPIALFSERGQPYVVCSSFSKNMGLYGERVGACTIVVDSDRTAATLLSHVKYHARCSYSNPVRHGAQLAALVLNSADLRAKWLAEVQTIRERLKRLRELLVETLHEIAPRIDASHIPVQRGMFSYSGLSEAQVIALREEFSIYALNNGRINIAGIRPENVERLCRAIASVSGLPAAAKSLAR